MEEKIKDYLKELLTDDCYKGCELQLQKVCEKLSLKNNHTINTFAAKFTEPELSGIIEKGEKEGEYNIYVNKYHPITRRRFTTAHEIGHYISAICGSYSEEQLFKGQGAVEDYAVSFRRDGERSPAEKEANEIAAEMLMPERWVKDLASQYKSIEEMSEIFFVSQAAIAIRLQNLGIDVL